MALWFALSVWTFRDIERRSSNVGVQVLATLVVVLGFLPGIAIYLLLRPRETLEQRYQREVEDSYLLQELNALPGCPGCSRPVNDEYLFCPDCGTTLRVSCGSCGRLANVDWRICAYCGHSLRRRPAPVGAGKGTSAGTATSRSSTGAAQWEVDFEGDGDSGTSRSRDRAAMPANGDHEDRR